MLTYPAVFVVGKPYSKGSMIPAVSSNGKPFLRADRDFELGRWSGKVREAAIDVWRKPLLLGSVFVTAAFHCPRPSLHYHEKDLDKLVRAVLDAMQQANVFKDDKQVALLAAIKYHLRADAPTPGVTLRFGPIEEASDGITDFMPELYHFASPLLPREQEESEPARAAGPVRTVFLR